VSPLDRVEPFEWPIVGLLVIFLSMPVLVQTVGVATIISVCFVLAAIGAAICWTEGLAINFRES
jgi:uncharacterized membrane protein